ncbi:MAG: DUF4838 domain-containing protein [Clostridia bacterium]|nr:DUF4838 domain-containing protein [Clostridia bacterium]
MLNIYKITANSVVDFAAEELKKYLRMMMTEGGDIKIAYDPAATDGFRLGLMQDMGLDVSDVPCPELDDIIYIDTDTAGGVIAGSNPRSVLFAVYEYLRKNGCRWLFPGVDGEYIPLKNTEPVKLRFIPSFRHRAQCIEGGNYQQNLIDNIDFSAKLGMNAYMLEFRVPPHYKNYYTHRNNPTLKPEPVSTETALQWKRMCETEMAKRGMEFHDVGHGWTGDSFVDRSQIVLGWATVDPETVSEETKQYLAMVNGKRGFFNDSPAATNFCMSNPKARKKVIEFILEYTKAHTNANYVHVWLADQVNNFCECDECRKKTPSDWFVVLLNELDKALEQEGLSNRIAFNAYMDTFWAPVTEVIQNPDRFLFTVGPITRKYTAPVDEARIKQLELPAYELNKSVVPTSIEEYLAYVEQWEKTWTGTTQAFEYHFWRFFVHSVSGISIARSAFEDAKVYKRQRFNALMQNGTQRCFFPTGLAFYAYARVIYDTSLSFDQVVEDYLSHLFGKDWRQFYEFLENAEKLLPHSYLALSNGRTHYVDPDMAKHIEENLDRVLAEGKALVESHYNSDLRVQTVAVRMLEYYLVYLEYYAKMMREKALGNDDEAMKIFEAFRNTMGTYEIYIQNFFDQYQTFSELGRMAERKEDSVLSVFYV